jgi:hypothetical protein
VPRFVVGRREVGGQAGEDLPLIDSIIRGTKWGRHVPMIMRRRRFQTKPPPSHYGRYRTRICDLYDRVDGQRVALASTFPTVPLRTGRTPFSVSGSPKMSSLSRSNHRKRTINKNNRHHTTLRVVVCAACLSALLPSRGSSLDLLLMTVLFHSARL